MSGMSAMRLIEFATPTQVAAVQAASDQVQMNLEALSAQLGNLSPDNVIQSDEFSAAAVRDLIKTVDGNGSGIDADLVRGQELSIKNGYLLTPNRPAFCVRDTAVSNAGVAGHQIWQGVEYNIGNHYSAATGRFTAPEQGLYKINARILSRKSVRADLFITKNGVNLLLNEVMPVSGGFGSVIFSETVHLDVGDYINLFTRYAHYGNSGYTTFAMSFIG